MPYIHTVYDSHVLSRGASEITRRDNNNDGGLQENTKIGIAIGLIFFLTILISFWLVWHWHSTRPPRTSEEEFRDDTLNRWMDNMTRPKATTRVYTPGEYENSRRESNSTFATYTTHGVLNEHELARPAQVYVAAPAHL